MPRRRPGPGGCRRRSTARCGRPRSTTWWPTPGPTLVIRSARRRATAPSRSVRRSPADPGDVAALFYTSGTTGKPKGARAHPPGPARRHVDRRPLLPAELRRDELVLGPAGRPHLRVRHRCVGAACAGIPVCFLPAVQPGRGARRHRAAAGHGLRRRAGHVPDAARGGRRRPRPDARSGCGSRAPTPCRAELAAPVQAASGATATLPLIGPVGEAAFAEGYGMVETGGGVAVRGLAADGAGVARRVDGHAAARHTASRWSTTTATRCPVGGVGELLRQGPGRAEGVPRRAGGDRRRAHRRRLAAHRRPRPPGPARASSTSRAA